MLALGEFSIPENVRGDRKKSRPKICSGSFKTNKLSEKWGVVIINNNNNNNNFQKTHQI